VQVVGDGLVLFHGPLPAVALDALQLAVDPPGPPAKAVDLAPDLLLPCSAGVRAEGEVRVGLFGPVCRFTGTPLPSRIIGQDVTSAAKGIGGVASGG
jgi:hypothetical protein